MFQYHAGRLSLVSELLVSSRHYFLASGMVLLTAAALLSVRGLIQILDVALVFLIAVTLASLFNTVWPSTIASVVAFFCFNFFFIPPYYTLSIAANSHVLALFVFLGAAVLTSQLVARARMRTIEAIQRGHQTETLYDLSNALISETTLAGTLNAIVVSVHQMFGLSTCAILLEEGGKVVERASLGETIDFQDRSLQVMARWAMDQHQSAGLDGNLERIRRPHPPGTPPAPKPSGVRQPGYILLVPIITKRRTLGVLMARRDRSGGAFNNEQAHLLETFANQAAIAIERNLLTEDQTKAQILLRSDELKSALLSAVSHDLRTPLASIKASATSLLQPGIEWTEEDRTDLLTAIDEEVDRMNQLITNLLDLSRIEAGAMRLDLSEYEPGELIESAVERAQTLLTRHQLVVDTPDDLPLVQVDYVKIVQVLVNLLQNAAKYSPEQSTITVIVRTDEGFLEIAVSDEGIGINPAHLERVFDKFYRVEDPTRPLGAGIGLAICKGYVEAHHGRIWAESNVNNGSVLRFTVPLAERAAATLQQQVVV